MNTSPKKVNTDNLKSEINSLKKSILNLKFQKSTGQLEKTSQIRKSRRKIASLKTLMNNKKGLKNA